MTKLGVCAVLLLIGSSPVFAQVTTLERNVLPSAGKDPNRMICEVAQTTGTRLGARKVCKTAAEWAQLKAETRANLEKVQQQATSTGIPSG